MKQDYLTDIARRAEKQADDILKEFNRIRELCQSSGKNTPSHELLSSLRQAASDAVQLGLGGLEECHWLYLPIKMSKLLKSNPNSLAFINLSQALEEDWEEKENNNIKLSIALSMMISYCADGACISPWAREWFVAYKITSSINDTLNTHKEIFSDELFAVKTIIKYLEKNRPTISASAMGIGGIRKRFCTWKSYSEKPEPNLSNKYSV